MAKRVLPPSLFALCALAILGQAPGSASVRLYFECSRQESEEIVQMVFVRSVMPQRVDVERVAEEASPSAVFIEDGEVVETADATP